MAGFGDRELMQRGRRVLVGAVMLVLGGVVGYALPQSNASPASDSGKATSVGNTTQGAGTPFEFQPAKGHGESLLLQDGTPRQDRPYGPWHRQGLPTCIVPGTKTPMKGTLGVPTPRRVWSA